MKPRILQIISTMNGADAEKQLGLLARRLPRDHFDLQICAITSGDTDVSPMPGATGVLPMPRATAGLSSSDVISPGATTAPVLPCRGYSTQSNLNTTGIPLTIIEKRWKYDPKSFWELKRLIDRFQPDLIHAWTPAGNFYGMAAAKAAGIKKFIAGYCCIDPFKSGFQLTIDRYIARHSILLATNSAGVRDFYIHKGLPAEKFHVIPSGIEPAQPSTNTRRQLLAELNLPENSRLIGLVSRLVSRNRVNDAIWAADLLKVIRKDVHLLIIGDGPHRDQLRRFRDQVRIHDFVHFLGQRRDLDRLMPHFDLLWSTSAYEGQSSAILQAMKVGVPVVAADTPGTRELILHRQTGFLVPVGDRAVFARYAHQLLDDTALSLRLSQAAGERVHREFPPDKMVSRHVEMYRWLLN